MLLFEPNLYFSGKNKLAGFILRMREKEHVYDNT